MVCVKWTWNQIQLVRVLKGIPSPALVGTPVRVVCVNRLDTRVCCLCDSAPWGIRQIHALLSNRMGHAQLDQALLTQSWTTRSLTRVMDHAQFDEMC